MRGCDPTAVAARRRDRRRTPPSAGERRGRAEAKVAATGEAIRWSVITIALLVFLPPVGVVVLIFGGARQLRSLYRLVLEPKLRKRFIDREVTRQVSATLSDERQQIVGEHARSMETLSASIAHEIRNPITAAKSLVQQMEEDPTAAENVEYARVALEELHRVERSVSHLLRFAREEEMGDRRRAHGGRDRFRARDLPRAPRRGAGSSWCAGRTARARCAATRSSSGA